MKPEPHIDILSPELTSVIDKINYLINSAVIEKNDCIMITNDEAKEITKAIKYAYASGVVDGMIDTINSTGSPSPSPEKIHFGEIEEYIHWYRENIYPMWNEDYTLNDIEKK